MARVRGHDQWLWHVLRREAEALIFPNTAAFFEGKYEPRDNTERLALVGACRFKNRTCAAARLYAEAFAADATLADDPRFSHRASAARAAALAGCGQGEDAAGPRGGGADEMALAGEGMAAGRSGGVGQGTGSRSRRGP